MFAYLHGSRRSEDVPWSQAGPGGRRQALAVIVQRAEFCAGTCRELAGGWEAGVFREGFLEEALSKLSPKAGKDSAGSM